MGGVEATLLISKTVFLKINMAEVMGEKFSRNGRRRPTFEEMLFSDIVVSGKPAIRSIGVS